MRRNVGVSVIAIMLVAGASFAIYNGYLIHRFERRIGNVQVVESVETYVVPGDLGLEANAYQVALSWAANNGVEVADLGAPVITVHNDGMASVSWSGLNQMVSVVSCTDGPIDGSGGFPPGGWPFPSPTRLVVSGRYHKIYNGI